MHTSTMCPRRGSSSSSSSHRGRQAAKTRSCRAFSRRNGAAVAVAPATTARRSSRLAFLPPASWLAGSNSKRSKRQQDLRDLRAVRVPASSSHRLRGRFHQDSAAAMAAMTAAAAAATLALGLIPARTTLLVSCENVGISSLIALCCAWLPGWCRLISTRVSLIPRNTTWVRSEVVKPRSLGRFFLSFFCPFRFASKRNRISPSCFLNASCRTRFTDCACLPLPSRSLSPSRPR